MPVVLEPVRDRDLAQHAERLRVVVAERSARHRRNPENLEEGAFRFHRPQPLRVRPIAQVPHLHSRVMVEVAGAKQLRRLLEAVTALGSELDLPVVGVMAVACFSLYRSFRKRDWL